MRPKWLAVFFFWVLAVAAAHAQQNPSPAKMGITRDTPYKLQVEAPDGSHTWSTIGFVDPTTFQFTPTGQVLTNGMPIVGGTDTYCLLNTGGHLAFAPCGTGGGGGSGTVGPSAGSNRLAYYPAAGTAVGPLATDPTVVGPLGAPLNAPGGFAGVGGSSPITSNDCLKMGPSGVVGANLPNCAPAGAMGQVDVRSVGMAPGGQDNGPYVGAVNAASLGTKMIFPAVVGQATTEYYFKNPFQWSATGTVSCQSPDYAQTVSIVVDPGIDGVTFDNGHVSLDGKWANGTLEGCKIVSLGLGPGVSSDGATFIDAVTMPGIGAIPGTTWQANDGILVVPYKGDFITPRYPNVLSVQPGAYVSAVNGQVLTLASPYKIDLDLSNTLYGYTYSTTANGTWTVGATTIPVTNCATLTTAGSVVSTEIHDATLSPVAYVGKAASCVGTTLTLQSPGAAVASSGATDVLNDGIAVKVVRLPAALAYTATTQGPINVNASASWLVNASSITVPSGTCNGMITGSMLTGGAPLTYGATVWDMTYSTPKNIGTVNTCVGTTMTLNGTGAAAASSGATDALTIVSGAILISGGNGAPLYESDLLWSDAFPFGTMVSNASATSFGSPASGGTETIIVTGVQDMVSTAYSVVTGSPTSFVGPWGGQNVACPGPPCIVASVTHAAGSGKIWKLSAGFHKRVTSDSRNIYPTGFVVGYEDVGNGDHGAAGRDWGNYILFNLVGRLNGGDDIAPNNEYGAMYGNNFVTDILSSETVHATHWGTNTNSAEGGTAQQSLMGDCSYMPTFIGMYSSDFTWNTPRQTNYCLPRSGAISIPPHPQSKTIVQGGTGFVNWTPQPGPVQAFPTANTAGNETAFDGNQYKGLGYIFSGPASNWKQGSIGTGDYQTTTAASSAGTSQLNMGTGNVPPQWFPGLLITDLNNPAAIVSGTTILYVPFVDATHNSSTIVLSQPLAGPVASGDTIQVSASTGPCMKLGGGLYDFGGLFIDKLCANATAQMLRYYGNYGFGGVWGWGQIPGSSFVPSFAFYNQTDYIGNRGALANGIIFPAGFMLGGPGAAPGKERFVGFGPAAPTVTSSTGTAAVAPFGTINTQIVLNSCTGVTAGYGLIDATLTAKPILGFVKGCSTTQPVLTLALNSSQASAGINDNLRDGATLFNAADFFNFGNIQIPVTNCAGINPADTITDTSLTGSPSIGTVSACGPAPVVTLGAASANASSGATDALVASNQMPGNLTLDATPAPGGPLGWIAGPSTSTAGTVYYPAGPIANDTAGTDYTVPKTLRSGTSANVDLVGRIQLTAGAKTFTLLNPTGTAPVCACWDADTPANLCSVSETATVLTFAGTGTDHIKWHCIGQN